MVPDSVRDELRLLANRYETPAFFEGDPGDPSRFMHLAEGDANREATAFVASCLSFGARRQFMGRIASLAAFARGDIDGWIRSGLYAREFPSGDGRCFYRFFTRGHVRAFLDAYRRLMEDFGTLGEYVRREARGDGLEAVRAICRRFGGCGAPVVPADARSACKRVCMFLRWMVRDGSPVDLGLWSDAIDRATLVMPLDVHVLRQSARLGLMPAATASMASARRLTSVLAEVFPGDPLRGDFALFGYGASAGAEKGRGKGR